MELTIKRVDATSVAFEWSPLVDIVFFLNKEGDVVKQAGKFIDRPTYNKMYNRACKILKKKKPVPPAQPVQVVPKQLGLGI